MADFIEYDKPESPDAVQRTQHIKVKCSNCGGLLGHFRVTGCISFINLEVNPTDCQCIASVSVQECQEYPAKEGTW